MTQQGGIIRIDRRIGKNRLGKVGLAKWVGLLALAGLLAIATLPAHLNAPTDAHGSLAQLHDGGSPWHG